VNACPRFSIVGRIRASDGKQPQWWRADVRSPAYFIPQHVLEAL
jgi:hypothetical protein